MVGASIFLENSEPWSRARGTDAVGSEVPNLLDSHVVMHPLSVVEY